MGQTMAEKIFSAKVGRKVYAGEYVTAPVDRVMGHEAFSSSAARIFSKGATVVASSPEPENVLSDYLQVGPPFVIRESEIDEVVDIFRQSIAEVFGEMQKEGLWG